MYERHFNLREKPFKLVPNPDYLYFSPSHAKALSHLRYATTQGDGFVLITGEVGTGKTTMCRYYLSGLGDEYEYAYIFNTQLNTTQLLLAICHELNVDVAKNDGVQAMLKSLNHFLMLQHQMGRKVILLIDEAQNLSVNSLEMIRLLSNLETSRDKLLLIILSGQPELAEKLNSFSLRQLSQRISLRCELSWLSSRQTHDFIKHRIMVAAKGPSDLFSPGACRVIHRYAKGIPRRINIAADRALLRAFEKKQSKVGRALAAKAVAELSSERKVRRPVNYLKSASYALVGLVLCLALGLIVLGKGSVGSALRLWSADSNQTVQTVDTENPDQEASRYKISASAISPQTEPGAPGTHPGHPIRENPETAAIASPEGSLAENPLIATSSAPLTTPVSQEVPLVEGTGLLPKQDFSFIEQVAALEHSTSRMDALAALLALWQQPQPHYGQLPESMPDEQFFYIAALQYGLRLLTIENDWDLVRQLNLPAIVALTPLPEGETVFGTLVSWQSDMMRFDLGNEQQPRAVVPATAQALANGPIYVFWYNTLGSDVVISQQSQGDAVVMLKKTLRSLGYVHLALDSVFDPPTYHAVVDFQMHHDIQPDGLVGPLTKIMLTADAQLAGIPSLGAEK